MLLYGFTDTVNDITREVLNLCSKSFFFSHRILWFLQSTDFESVEITPSTDPKLLINRIIEISQSFQHFFLGNGEKLYDLYKTLKITHSIPNNDEIEEEPQGQYDTREIIQRYRDGSFSIESSSEIDPKYIPLPDFMTDHQSKFLSTMSFVDALTLISHELLKVQNKTEFLVSQLTLLNRLLPAGVYVPFNLFKARNCAVLHIPVSEARVFTTKERAPFKISIEVFRPYLEISKASKIEKPERSRDRAVSFQTEARRTESFAFSNVSKGLNASMDSDLTSESFFDKDDLPRRRNQTFAIIRDKDSIEPEFKHYANLFVSPNRGSVAVVYGEVDESGQNVSVFKESFKQQEERIKRSSPFGKLSTWSLLHVIVKSGDDLRQEQLAMQLISFFKQTFDEKKIDIWLYPYDILATGIDCGILECVPDAVSIDGLKKSLPADQSTLYDFFLLQFGQRKSKRFKNAKKCFMKSLVGYSLVCYILKIKDRHNGNILIDRNGHLIHIDFGFMLSNSPGGNINFEQAPFKFSQEFENVLGGRRSKLFQEFRSLCVKGYSAIKEKAEQVILMVEMMRSGTGSNLGCFIGGESAITELRERLLPKAKMSEGDCKEYINDLIDISLDNWSTKCYDRFQYCCQNIFY